MVKPNIFEVTLNRRHGSYLPGEVVDGYVTMEVLEEMEVNSIYLEAKGEEWVRVTDGVGRHQEVETESRNFFDQRIDFYKPAPSTKMPPMRYTYPFQISLPNHTKTAFEGDYGHVRYKLKCTIEVPGMAFDHTAKKYFTITRPVDLSQHFVDAREPVEKSEEGTFCCWCCESDKVTCSFRIDKGVYVCGEAVRIFGNVNNPSNRPIKVSVCFRRKVKYKINNLKESQTDDLYDQDMWNVAPGENAPLDGMVQIPPCAPQSPAFPMDYFHYLYQIQICVEPLGFCSGLPMLLELPVNIGTIPIPGSFNVYTRKQAGGATQQPLPGGLQQIPPVSLVPLPFFMKQHELEHNPPKKPEKNDEGQAPPDVDDLGNFHPSYPFYSWDNVYFTLGCGEGADGMQGSVPMAPPGDQPPLYPALESSPYPPGPAGTWQQQGGFGGGHHTDGVNSEKQPYK